MSQLEELIQALNDVEVILAVEPNNVEYIQTKATLLEAIALLQAVEQSETAPSQSPSLSTSTAVDTQLSTQETANKYVDLKTADSGKENDGKPPLTYPIESRVLALWAEDNNFHIARIDSYDDVTQKYQVRLSHPSLEIFYGWNHKR